MLAAGWYVLNVFERTVYKLKGNFDDEFVTIPGKTRDNFPWAEDMICSTKPEDIWWWLEDSD